LLGYAPETPLLTGLQRTYQWFQARREAWALGAPWVGSRVGEPALG